MVSGALGKIYTDGEIIVKQGDSGDCMYEILEGKVEVIEESTEQQVQLAYGDADRVGDAGWVKAGVGEPPLDLALGRRELRRAQGIPPLALSLVGSPAGERYKAGQVAQHAFAEFVGKERNLRVRRVDGGAEKRAERGSGGQSEGAREAPPGKQRRHDGVWNGQDVEPSRAF